MSLVYHACSSNYKDTTVLTLNRDGTFTVRGGDSYQDSMDITGYNFSIDKTISGTFQVNNQEISLIVTQLKDTWSKTTEVDRIDEYNLIWKVPESFGSSPPAILSNCPACEFNCDTVLKIQGQKFKLMKCDNWNLGKSARS